MTISLSAFEGHGTEAPPVIMLGALKYIEVFPLQPSEKDPAIAKVRMREAVMRCALKKLDAEVAAALQTLRQNP